MGRKADWGKLAVRRDKRITPPPKGGPRIPAGAHAPEPKSEKNPGEGERLEGLRKIHPGEGEPLLRDIRDVLAFILALILTITAALAIPSGIAAWGSYIAYKAGLPYNIPIAIGTAALTAIWYFILTAWFQWTSDSGETWRANKSARENQEIQEKTTEET